jgi:type I restriction enzyme M protein
MLYLPEQARFSYLLQLLEGAGLGRAINDAMKAVEAENEELKGVLRSPTSAWRTTRWQRC